MIRHQIKETTDTQLNQDHNWWQGAVIYQVYPRSFQDSNNDGVGDLPGIIAKMDYIASLGVDAIWISPFFKSPMQDFGYDISDYREVDPLFGCLEDFDRLIDSAHKAGIKVIIDQVLSHTSDQHEWFKLSRSSKDNPKSDWYVWADAGPDGAPPNNWLSIFGGGAWEWDPVRKQYYLHNFLASQPDLNFHNTAVQQQILDEVEFWLQRGVDGLRLDAINFCFHDQQLRDNPPKPENERQGRGFKEDNPYAFQYHYYNNTQPENLAFLEKLRQLMNRYPNTVTLGEISSEDSLATMAEYTSGDQRLHMAYSFELLVDNFSTDYIRKTVETLEQRLSNGWPCWSIGNHDVQRVISRWTAKHSNQQNTENLAKMFNALIASLRGSTCHYQGEELGLTEVDIERQHLQDPYGLAFWPNFKGRDGCRTPMPWNSSEPQAGFSTAEPWLPIPAQHRDKAVEKQTSDPNSVLNAYRHFIQWRKHQPTLKLGSITFLDTNEGILSFIREYDTEKMLVGFNFSDQAVVIPKPGDRSINLLNGHGFTGATLDEHYIKLPSYSACFAKISP